MKYLNLKTISITFVIILIFFIILIIKKGKIPMAGFQDKETSSANHLIHERSPYLQQHAHNPVDWYPWGEEAFEKAKKENKPILLSIGYSACHWCHVMAHESFENETIAAVMNEYFVNIKVDREEYPDVDHLYQTFVQMTTGHGGWPLTVFLTPDLVPFYGGTYFPAVSKYGMISFPELIHRIHDVYIKDQSRITQSTAEIQKVLTQMSQIEVGDTLPLAEQVFENLYRSLQNSFDSQNGGFSQAPKFPHVADMDFLLNYFYYTGMEEAKNMVLFTLRKMADGGIYDQIGGGFHRYSTDSYWLVPHFEKMLYDNALLIPLYVNAYRLTGDEYYLNIARETANFVLRELKDGAGGFYSTLDADSEGEEGKFYVWDYQEIQDLLDEDIRESFCEYYDITPQGNFEGKNILHLQGPLASFAQKYQIDSITLAKKFADARKKLLKKQSERVRPGLDDKILTDWNGMMISGLWQVYQVTKEKKYRSAAEKALKNCLQNFTTKDGAIFHFIGSDNEKITGYLDDYAYFIQALLDGFETIQKDEFLNQAILLMNYALAHFWDDQVGGFFFTDKQSTNTFARLRQNYDASTPSGNNIMCLNLLRIHSYTGENKYDQIAEEMFRLHKSDLENKTTAFTSLVRALLYFHNSPVEITISIPSEKKKSEFIDTIYKLFAPCKIIIRTDRIKANSPVSSTLLKGRQVDDKEAVFVCFRNTCSLPVYEKSLLSDVFQNFGLHTQ